MSAETLVAKRYAKALFQIAQEQGKVAETEADLQAVVQVIEGNRDLQKLLQHPNVALSVKIDLLKKAFESNISDIVFNTITLLLERRRENVLTALLNAYVAISNEAMGQANATVYTPLPLSAEDAAKLSEHFGKLIGKKIRMEHVIDQSLMGGFQVRIGDRLYDGSLAGKLARLEKQLNRSQAL